MAIGKKMAQTTLEILGKLLEAEDLNDGQMYRGMVAINPFK